MDPGASRPLSPPTRNNGPVTIGGQSEGPVTVLMTDIEGSTDLQSRLGDAAARAPPAAARRASPADAGALRRRAPPWAPARRAGLGRARGGPAAAPARGAPGAAGRPTPPTWASPGRGAVATTTRTTPTSVSCF